MSWNGVSEFSVKTSWGVLERVRDCLPRSFKLRLKCVNWNKKAPQLTGGTDSRGAIFSYYHYWLAHANYNFTNTTVVKWLKIKQQGAKFKFKKIK